MNPSDKAGRYCYEKTLVSEWCHMCKCAEYICVHLLCSCNGTKKIVRHDIILSVLKATTWFLHLTIAFFDRMQTLLLCLDTGKLTKQNFCYIDILSRYSYICNPPFILL